MADTGLPIALERRRTAACRLPALPCSCRDPWLCRCDTAAGELTGRYLDGWRDAAEHLLEVGIVTSVPAGVLRALWRRGGTDRALAERLARAGAR
ncbi:hypothetical protein Q3O43_20080 [Rhodococcus aetherivorans]|uniref:hypothetical protein n=1 Tax=Rhodococcus aetherivorans TaxID=191292 RepID=UPI0026EA9188|nr:hypothetical protein [Rhodococcus aetherivorans]WKW97320.1 hypothetical protein Q3O43_20080 [Rhodococcus aetherivorans]